MCGLLTFGAGTASATEPPDIVQLVAAMQQEGQNAAEKATFTGGGYRASLVRAAETAAPAAAAAPVSTPAQEDPGETGGDEEPSEPAQVTQHSIHDENGYYVHNGSAYNSITKDGLWVGGTDENTGFHVDSDGNVTTTGSITVNRTGGAGSVTIDASTGKITGVTAGDIRADSTDAVNGSQLYNAIKGAEGTTYAAGDSVAMTDGSTTGEDKTISVKAGNGIEAGADGVAVKVNGNNLTVNENGLSLSETLSGLTSVTASGTVAAGNFAAGNVKINADNSGKITGLADGEISDTSTDAVTGKQLNDVKEAAEELDGLAVKYTDGNKTAVDLGSATLTTTGAITGGSVKVDGVTINGGKITGLTTASITENTDAANKEYVDKAVADIDVPEYKAGNGIAITGDTISAKAKQDGNIVVDENGISLAKEVTGLTSVSADQLTATNSLTAGSIIVDGKTYISSEGLNANGKITGVTAGDISATSTEAVNGSQLFEIKKVSDLAVTYTDDDKTQVKLAGDGGTTITNVKNGALNEDSTEAVNGSQLYAVDEKVGDADWIASNLLNDAKDLTNAAQILDSKMGDVNFTGTNLITNEKNLTDAARTLDATIGNLTMSKPMAYWDVGHKETTVTSALDNLSAAIGRMDFDGKNFIGNDGNLSSAIVRLDDGLGLALESVGFRKEESGKITTSIDWSGFNYSGKTIVDTMRNLDGQLFELTGRVDALDGGGTKSLSAFSKMSTANVSALSALSNMDTETAETLASMSSEQVETLAAKAPAAAPAAPAPGDPAATSTRPGPDGESETGDSGDAYEVKQDLHVTGDTTLDGALTVDGAGTFNSGLTVNPKTEGGTAFTVNGGASINGTLNMNDNKITGVADGEISETSTDAVNGSQLWGVQQDIENNASAIASLGGQVSRLDNRIDRVGAGAAALAALHPLDYDPEVKWDFAAGYGNYRGANAVSVGAFYRPNEDVMFSVGGSMGGGENMVNAGVSFKLGSGSGLTTSRTAMARELAAMKDTVAAQNAQIEAQAKQIEELTALVAQLAAEKAGAPEEKKA